MEVGIVRRDPGAAVFHNYRSYRAKAVYDPTPVYLSCNGSSLYCVMEENQTRACGSTVVYTVVYQFLIFKELVRAIE